VIDDALLEELHPDLDVWLCDDELRQKFGYGITEISFDEDRVLVEFVKAA
jgi:hypothetical protein